MITTGPAFSASPNFGKAASQRVSQPHRTQRLEGFTDLKKKKTATQHTSTVVRKLCFYISTWRVYWDILRDSTRQNTSLLPMLWTNCSKSDPKTELPLVALFIGKNPTLNFNHQFRVTFFSKVTTMMFPGHKWSYGAP